MAKTTFAAGCFWGIEAIFQKLPGVLKTCVGYTGGRTTNPTYQQVCAGNTGHAEAVEIEFDPKIISYETLLDIFWKCHNPTLLNRQGPDIGFQYRSAIFFHTDEQKQQAIASKNKLFESGRYQEPIVTEIAPAQVFYPAEEYHQNYYAKHSRTCSIPEDLKHLFKDQT